MRRFIKTPEQIETMRQGGRILARILGELVSRARPGVRTKDMDAFAAERMRQHRVQPSFLGYMKFPAVVCLSVNDEAVHGVPSDRLLADGDLLKIDIGVIYGGLHTDMATTIIVTNANALTQKISRKFAPHRRLMNAAREGLSAGIRAAHPGNTVREIGKAVEDVFKRYGCTALKELGGHGIGEKLHDEPFVPNWDDPDADTPLIPGMTLALEPIASLGKSWQIKDGDDGFVYKTKDGSLSSHFEHTVVITERGAEVLTK